MAAQKERDIANDSRFRAVVQQMAGGYRTIGQMVYEVLREAIISGAFAPGEWLRQESLAAAIGVSRIPVRTALLQLEAEGLVNFHPHRGAQIRSLSPAQIQEVYQLRILLQTYALRRSMARMTPERLEKLRYLAEQLDGEPEGGEFLAIRVEFYRELHDAENNPVLGEILEELSGQVGRYLLSFRVDPHSHVELVDLIAAGDEAGAQSWIRTHLENVCARINDLAYGEEQAEPAAGS
jgi:DNA-binding GntR family transcriptional regulator